MLPLSPSAILRTPSHKLPASLPPCLPSPLRRCPACQHFQPEYEKVAAFLAQRSGAQQQPAITVARLDCADHVRREGEGAHVGQQQCTSHCVLH